MNNPLTQPTMPRPALDRFIESYHGCAILLGGSLLLFAWSRIIGFVSRDHFERSLCLLIGLSALFLVRQWRLRHTASSSAIALSCTWLGVCLYFGAVVHWNLIYVEHVATSGYAHDIFRNALRSFQSPVYGYAKPFTTHGVLLAVLFCSLYVTIVRTALIHADTHPKSVAMAFMVLLSLAIAVFAVLDGHGHWPAATAIHAGFLPAPGSFDSLSAVWSQWNVYLSIPRGQAGHYPPTLSYLALFEQHYDLPGVLMSASIIATVLCIPLTFRLCAALELSPATSVCAAALQVASAALFTFPPVKSTALTAFLTLLGLIGVIRALRGSPWSAFLAGLALGFYGLYSFTAFFAGLMIMGLAPTAALYGVIPWRRAMLVVVLVLLASSAVWVAAYLTSGFDLSACLKLSIANNRASMSHELLDSPLRYALRSTGNLLAYTAYLGPLAMLYAAFGLRSARSGLARAFVMTTLITLALAAFAGVFFLETERIWVFFTPSMTVIAGLSMVTLWPGSALRDTGAMLLLASALMAWTIALGMTQHIPHSETVDATIVRKSLEVLAPAHAPARTVPQ